MIKRLFRFLFASSLVPAGPEIGVDDDGALCPGVPTGETSPVFLSPVHRRVIFPRGELDLLEEIASRSLGPSDPRLLGRVDGRAVTE